MTTAFEVAGTRPLAAPVGSGGTVEFVDGSELVVRALSPSMIWAVRPFEGSVAAPRRDAENGQDRVASGR